MGACIMTLQEFIAAQKEELQKELMTKTGWGRVEVAAVFERATTQALLRFSTGITPA